MGGAILLGGIAIVAWRIWGKKKREAAAKNEFRSSHDEMLQQDTSGMERYNNPNGGVNTASNF